MYRNGGTPPRRLRAQSSPASGVRRSSSAGVVLRAVLDHGPIARSTIARLTGLSPASVTGHTAELIRLGLLKEMLEMTAPNGVGRPHVPVDLDTDHHIVCGVHIAIPHATVALLDLRGRVIVQHREPHAGASPLRVLERAASVLWALLAEHAGDRVPLGLGAASGGWVDQTTGMLVEHPLLGWHDVPLRDILADQTGLLVQVDAHSRALVHAERLFGQHRARASIVHLFVGNVVDAAFGTGDTVHHGPRSAAGAIAHLPVEGSTELCSCGRSGCLQATVSERTLARRAADAAIIAEPSLPALLRLAQDGDRAAMRLFLDRARCLGRAAAQLIDVFNPEVLVVVEQGVSHLPGCLAELRNEVSARSWVCKDPEQTVVATSFPGHALATSAGAVMLDMLHRDPLGPISDRLCRAS